MSVPYDVFGNYGENFGLDISTEIITRGDLKTPAASGDWKQGQLVKANTAAAGELMLAADNDVPSPRFCGLLMYVNRSQDNPFEPAIKPNAQKGDIKRDTRALIVNGAGVSFWLKNTSDRTIFVTTDVAVGGYLKWTGTQFANTSTAAQYVARVTHYDAASQQLVASLIA